MPNFIDELGRMKQAIHSVDNYAFWVSNAMLVYEVDKKIKVITEIIVILYANLVSITHIYLDVLKKILEYSIRMLESV